MKTQVLCLTVLALLPLAAYGGLVGGQVPYETNLHDTNVVFGVNAINDYFKSQNDARPRTAVKLVSATSQVVAGVMYRFKIEVTGGDKNEICTVAVWSRVWLSDPDKTVLVKAPSCQ